MFSEEDIVVKVLQHGYGRVISYRTYNDYIADIPTLIHLGYISVKNTYRGHSNFFVKIEPLKSYMVKYDFYNSDESYTTALYTEGVMRPISFGYEFKELVEYLEGL